MIGSIISSVQAGDLIAVRALLDAGVDVHTRDEHDWTPLNWAAGRGDLEMVRLLLDRGADVYRVGRDQRTPYLIALAAGHAPVCRLLRDVEAQGGDASQSSRREKAYCKAYYLRDLRRWPDWREPESALPLFSESGDPARPSEDDDVVFIHQDFSVTKSMWHGEDVLLADASADFRSFCTNELGFSVPDDVELIEREKPRESGSTRSPSDRQEAFGHEVG